MKMENRTRSVGMKTNGRLPWPSYWEENEDSSSISGLNIEHTRELSHLVEDQEIAAQAVAFVVNSSRKGIVPLCADVAHIMRTKRSLEHKLARLRGENDVLRSSLSASSCTSPTPASLTSYEHKPQADRTSPCLCSRCSSQCSSLLSNSPKLFHHQRSPRLPRTSSAFSAVPGEASVYSTQGVAAMVHHPPQQSHNTTLPTSPSRKVKGHRRKNSLPEMVSEPHCNVPKVSPRFKKVSAEVQCSLATTNLNSTPDAAPNSECNTTAPDNEVSNQTEVSKPDQSTAVTKSDSMSSKPDTESSQPEPCATVSKSECNTTVSAVPTCASTPSLEQQFKDTLQANARLAEELAAARKEVLQLQSRVKENEMIQLAKQYGSSSTSSIAQYYVEKETTDPTSSTPTVLNCPQCSHTIPLASGGAGEDLGSVQGQGGARLKTPSPVMIGGYLPGCKCAQCEKLATETTSAHKVKKSAAGSSLQIELEDHVVVQGEKTGVVKYIGHLDGAQLNAVFVGLELDAPVGQHCGIVNGKRYYTCARDYGLVVPLPHVISVISKQQKLQQKSSSSSCCSKLSLSTSSTSSSNPAVPLSSSSSQYHKPSAAPLSPSLSSSHRPSPPPPRIFRSLSERVERGSVERICIQKKQRGPPTFKGEPRFVTTEPQNLKLPKDDKLCGGHLV